MRLPEEKKIVPVMNYVDISSTVHTDCINMKDYHKCTFIFLLHALAGASAALTVTSGAADAAYTSAMNFKYAFGGAAIASASCDVLAADAEKVASLTLTYGSYSGFMLIVEVNADEMDVANGENWLAANITTASSVTGRVSCIAILEPRYTGNCSESSLD